jgi:hypothetical protein
VEILREPRGNRSESSSETATREQSERVPILIALEAFVLIIFSAVAVFNVWVVMMVCWFALYVAIRFAVRRGWMANLTGPALRAHIICVVMFPLVATVWKYSQIRYQLGDGGFPNRVEHFTWAAAMVGYLLPLLARWWAPRRRWEQVMISVALVSMIGNGVELMEYLAKIPKLRLHPLWADGVLRDTMADITTNVFGATAAALLFAAILARVARSSDGIARGAQGAHHSDRSHRLADVSSRRTTA